MEHFIGCDAHKAFFVFVAVKSDAGKALRVAHYRVLYRESPARLPAHSLSRWKRVEITIGWSMKWNGQATDPSCAIHWRQSRGWG